MTPPSQGTERQDVSNDYSERISEGHFEVEAGVAKALQKLTGITGELGHCNCNAAGTFSLAGIAGLGTD